MAKSSKKSSKNSRKNLPSKPQGLDKALLNSVEGLFEETQNVKAVPVAKKVKKSSKKAAILAAISATMDPGLRDSLILGHKDVQHPSKKALKRAKKLAESQAGGHRDGVRSEEYEDQNGPSLSSILEGVNVGGDEPVTPQDALLESVIGKGPAVMSKKGKATKRVLKSKGKVLPAWPADARPFTEFVHSNTSRSEAVVVNAPHDLCVTFSEIPLMYAFHVATDHEQVNHLFSKLNSVNGVAFFVKVGYRAAVLIGAVHPDAPDEMLGTVYHKVIFNLADPVVACNLDIKYSLAV